MENNSTALKNHVVRQEKKNRKYFLEAENVICGVVVLIVIKTKHATPCLS